ncbi:MAG TPA: hypothetical protein VGG83_26940 [Trebonia sp.]|jgi:hypothetical protein
MSDEVGVDVERIGQLASALENLRNVLAANVPTIVNTMNGYWSSGTGSPISLQPLQQAQSRSVDDATDIRDRATMAVAYQNRPNPTLSGNMVEIPWDSSQQQLDADSSKAAAQNLAAAEAESAKNPKAARVQIQAIQAEIQDNVDSGDTTWLGTFYNTAAPQVANLAATLNGEDGQTVVDGEPAVLTSQDQQILKTFATGLASADKSGKITNISGYADAKNLWSVGMLFKFGPSGSAYGTQELGNGKQNLLAQVTTAIELARLKPGGYTIPLNGSNVETGAWGADYTTQSLAEFDPAQAMLTLATQNGAAAREVLAAPSGAKIAASLMNTPTTFYEPLFNGSTLEGFFPEVPPNQYLRGTPTDFNEPLYATAHPVTLSSSVIGSFFNTATNVPRGTGPAAYDAASAAMNIVASTPPPGTAQLAAPVQSALLATAQRYMLDLGGSATNSSPASIVQRLVQGNSKTPWSVTFGDTGMTNFLQQITSNPTDDGVLMASARTMFSNYYGLMAANKLPSDMTGMDPAREMAQLMAQIQTQSNNVGIQGAQATDAQHAQLNALLSFAESEVTKAPVVGAPLGDAQTAAGLLGINLPSFSTNNAVTDYVNDQQNFATQQMQINLPMAQGLIHYGLIPPPTGQSWYHNGTINLQGKDTTTTQQNEAEFNSWYNQVARTKTPNVSNGTFESDVNMYQSAMGLQKDESLITVTPGS